MKIVRILNRSKSTISREIRRNKGLRGYRSKQVHRFAQKQRRSMMEWIIRKIRCRTRVVVAVPDGQSALMLCAARFRHIAGTKWGTRWYLNMDTLYPQAIETATA